MKHLSVFDESQVHQLVYNLQIMNLQSLMIRCFFKGTFVLLKIIIIQFKTLQINGDQALVSFIKELVR